MPATAAASKVENDSETVALPIASYTIHSTLPPQASYHRRLGKAGSKSLWQSKEFNINKWKAEKTRKDCLVLEVMNNSKIDVSFQKPPSPRRPKYNVNKTNATNNKLHSNNNDNNHNIIPSPRATKWIVEKRSRYHFFKALAVPHMT